MGEQKKKEYRIVTECVKHCADCGGRGYISYSSGGECHICRGTGYTNSYEGYERGRRVMYGKMCWMCNGSGRAIGGASTEYEPCPTCKGHPCLESREYKVEK